MSYSVVRKPRTVATRGTGGDGSHDRGGATGRCGLGTAPATVTGVSTGGLGTGITGTGRGGLGTGITGTGRGGLGTGITGTGRGGLGTGSTGRGGLGTGSTGRGGLGTGRGGLGTCSTGRGGLGTSRGGLGTGGTGRGGLGTGRLGTGRVSIGGGGLGTGRGGGGLEIGTSKGKGSSTLLQRCPVTHQKATVHKSAPKTTHSYGAYSVTVPDQKKRSDLQKRAAAELAALEKLKCRNIHVSITPSAVGGTLTQEEVRRKQQQDFSKAETLQTELSGPTPAKPKE